MTTPTLVTVKQAIISRLRSSLLVTALLSSGASEIRELEWQGTDFKYPNVRVRVDEFRLMGDSNCAYSVAATIYAFAENASSLIADKIGVEVFALFDRRAFTEPATTLKFVAIRATQLGASWVEASGVWQSDVQLTFQVS
jgi:hypothetical protein